MAKKKSPVKTAKKKSVAVKRAKIKTAGAKGAKAKPSKAASRAKPVTKAPKKRPSSKPEEPKLGRPTVTGEELLYMLFREDYHARQIFDFLRVQTVKELEQYSPQQIVKLLSKPITDTVNRIRRKLAEKNRHLLDDAQFAFEAKQGQ